MNDFRKFYLSKNNKSSILDSQASYLDKLTETSDIMGKLLNDRIIFLSSDIDNYSATVVKAQILYLNSVGTEDIKMYIDSPGGSIYTGLGLIDVMEFSKCDIETVNIGLAASMAAVVLAAGTKGKRKSLKRARTMIHQPLGYFGFQQASDHEVDAAEITYLKSELYKIISEKSGQALDKVKKDGDRDYWLSAQESKEYGMIDHIIKSNS